LLSKALSEYTQSESYEDSTPAIVYEGIEKNFGSLKVLQGISGSINRGEVVGSGSSGCGKSTLLRCFNRLEKIDRGRLEVNGIDLSRPDLSQTSAETAY